MRCELAIRVSRSRRSLWCVPPSIVAARAPPLLAPNGHVWALERPVRWRRVSDASAHPHPTALQAVQRIVPALRALLGASEVASRASTGSGVSARGGRAPRVEGLHLAGARSPPPHTTRHEDVAARRARSSARGARLAAEEGRASRPEGVSTPACACRVVCRTELGARALSARTLFHLRPHVTHAHPLFPHPPARRARRALEAPGE